MSDQSQKRVDESWKERVEQEKQQTDQPGAQRAPSPVVQDPSARPSEAKQAPAAGGGQEMPEARFDLFVSGLAMDALIALGDVPHPVTKKPAANLVHARYLVDVLGVLEEKTRGNLTVDEERLMKDALYQLRMRYMAKAGGS